MHCHRVHTQHLYECILPNTHTHTHTHTHTPPLAVKLHLRSLLFTMGFYHIKTKGRRATAKEAPIVLCNHVCFVEPVILLMYFLAGPVGAIENLRNPIIGPILQYLQCITVDRADPSSRRNVVTTMQQRSGQEAKGAWPQTLIFPEGTTTNGKALISFKSGAFIPGVPVQPCIVRYPYRNFDPCWVNGGPGLAMLLYRMNCQLINYVSVDFLDVYTPSAAEKADARLYAFNVRHLVAKAMGVPATAHTLDDVKLSGLAKKVRKKEFVPRVIEES